MPTIRGRLLAATVDLRRRRSLAILGAIGVIAAAGSLIAYRLLHALRASSSPSRRSDGEFVQVLKALPVYAIGQAVKRTPQFVIRVGHGCTRLAATSPSSENRRGSSSSTRHRR